MSKDNKPITNGIFDKIIAKTLQSNPNVTIGQARKSIVESYPQAKIKQRQQKTEQKV